MTKLANEGQSTEASRNENPPFFRFTEEGWGYCLELARTNGLTEKEVVHALMVSAIKIALIEKLGDGEIVWRRANRGEVPIKTFSNGKNSTLNGKNNHG